MSAKSPIRWALKSSQQMLNMYLEDLSDTDLLIRPAPHANHIAWQLGHLINSEVGMGTKYIPGASYPALPADWAKQHGKETAAVDPPRGFKTKQEYLGLFKQVREASLKALEQISEADLEKPTGWEMCPTVGGLFILQSRHIDMHGGQFTVVRRKLGKPVLF